MFTDFTINLQSRLLAPKLLFPISQFKLYFAPLLYPREVFPARFISPSRRRQGAFSISERHTKAQPLSSPHEKFRKSCIHVSVPYPSRTRDKARLKPSSLTVPRTVSPRVGRARFPRVAQYATIASSWREKHMSDAFPPAEASKCHRDSGFLNLSLLSTLWSPFRRRVEIRTHLRVSVNRKSNICKWIKEQMLLIYNPIKLSVI